MVNLEADLELSTKYFKEEFFDLVKCLSKNRVYLNGITFVSTSGDFNTYICRETPSSFKGLVRYTLADIENLFEQKFEIEDFSIHFPDTIIDFTPYLNDLGKKEIPRKISEYLVRLTS